MEVFEVGKVYKPAIGIGEGVRFDLSYAGATLMYVFDAPSPDEVAQMRSGKSFEIRYTEQCGIIWVTSKCGNLAWTDAPYNPRLSSDLPPAYYEDGEGLALTLVMIDARDAVVKSVRLIGLGTRFSHDLTETAMALREQPMTMAEAHNAITYTMARCTSEDLAKVAPSFARFRI